MLTLSKRALGPQGARAAAGARSCRGRGPPGIGVEVSNEGAGEAGAIAPASISSLRGLRNENGKNRGSAFEKAQRRRDPAGPSALDSPSEGEL